MFEAFVLATALAMDATAVAAARGVARPSPRNALVLAIAFGVFQAAMAALGWILGATTANWVAAWDHWLAFGLLALIGGKMLYEAFRNDPDDADRNGGPLRARTVVILSLATSIDALAAGITLPVLQAPIALSLALIGGISFALSLAGGLAGAALGSRAGRTLEIAGGVALIGIGVKTLIDHLGG